MVTDLVSRVRGHDIALESILEHVGLALIVR